MPTMYNVPGVAKLMKSEEPPPTPKILKSFKEKNLKISFHNALKNTLFVWSQNDRGKHREIVYGVIPQVDKPSQI